MHPGHANRAATRLARRISMSAVAHALTILVAGAPQLARAQTIDPAFPSTDGVVNAVVRDGNTLYIGGNFTMVGPSTGSGVPVDKTNGLPVSPFAKVAGIVEAAASDGSGGWYIGGLFSAVGGVPRSNLAHINGDGSVASWDPGTDQTVYALALSGSTVYVCGIFNHAGGQPRNDIAALDAVTGVPTAWD